MRLFDRFFGTTSFARLLKRLDLMVTFDQGLQVATEAITEKHGYPNDDSRRHGDQLKS
jgi:hypothetical protein